jgi:hypothetical protein
MKRDARNGSSLPFCGTKRIIKNTLWLALYIFGSRSRYQESGPPVICSSHRNKTSQPQIQWQFVVVHTRFDRFLQRSTPGSLSHLQLTMDKDTALVSTTVPDYHDGLHEKSTKPANDGGPSGSSDRGVFQVSSTSRLLDDTVH